MSSSKSVLLTLTFNVERQDDDGWPWVFSLLRVEPRQTDGCPDGCDSTNIRQRLCDACAVENSIQDHGPEQWLLRCDPPIITDPMPDDDRFRRPASSHRIIDREGKLTVRGHMEVWDWSGINGPDWDEKFHIESSEFGESEKWTEEEVAQINERAAKMWEVFGPPKDEPK
jgi:hypothetical protein